MSEEYPVYPSRWIRFQRWVRHVTVAYIVGMAFGAYSVYEHIYLPFEESIIDRGYCGQRDAFKTAFRYPCRDSMIGMELQQRAIAEDQEQAVAVQRENKAILADMDRHQPKKVAKSK